jgi:hypothetical protein
MIKHKYCPAALQQVAGAKARPPGNMLLRRLRNFSSMHEFKKQVCFAFRITKFQGLELIKSQCNQTQCPSCPWSAHVDYLSNLVLGFILFISFGLHVSVGMWLRTLRMTLHCYCITRKLKVENLLMLCRIYVPFMKMFAHV